jgi:hypothetical protein
MPAALEAEAVLRSHQIQAGQRRAYLDFDHFAIFENCQNRRIANNLKIEAPSRYLK